MQSLIRSKSAGVTGRRGTVGAGPGRATAACGPVGGVGGGGRAAASLLPLRVAAHSTPSWPPSCRRRTPLRRARAVGVAEPPRGGGGMRGGPRTAPPGAPADLNHPSALPEWAVVMGGSCGARPPYCCGAPPCAAPKLGSRVAPARWCGLALRPQPPRERLGALGRAMCSSSRIPPPVSGSLPGEGGRPLGSGGAEGRSCGSQAGGGERGGGEGGWGGRLPAPPPRRASACHLLSPACPPGVNSCRPGCRAAAGVRRGLVGRQRVSAAGGGGRGGKPPRPGWRPRLPRAGL